MFGTSTVNLMEIQVNLAMLSTASKLTKMSYATLPVLESRDNLHGNIWGKKVVPNYIHLPAKCRDWTKL